MIQIRFIWQLVVSLGFVLSLSACGTIYTGNDSGAYQPASTGPATPQACQQAIAAANQKLGDFKSQKNTGAVDLSALGQLLGQATKAQQASDYKSCEVKAQEVLSYIQRDENYLQWDRSLQP